MLVDLWQAVELLVFLPFYLTTVGALLAAAGETDGARESLRAIAGAGRRAPACASTTPRRSGCSRRSATIASRGSGGARAGARAGRAAVRAPDRARPARPGRVKVAILGGGMAGDGRRLAAERARLAGRVRVDHRLPARLAAGRQGREQRGAHGRIEEHGLHLWLGYYENAFRLLRECYAELDRPRTDPARADPDLARRACSPPGRSGSRTAAPTAGTTGSGTFTAKRRSARGARPGGRQVLAARADGAHAAADRRLPRLARPTATRPGRERPPVAGAGLLDGARVGVAAGLDPTPLDRGRLQRLAGVRSALAEESVTDPTCAARGTSSRS